MSRSYMVCSLTCTEARGQHGALMSTAAKCSWTGVYPAAPTQFGADLALDARATCAVQAALVRDGVHGMVLLGTVGENNSLTAEEKRTVLRGAVETVGGRVPLIARVSGLTTPTPAAY